ncbi:MAG: transketolase C-terminal domain-containing protein, partial [Pseudomonadota bacterium]|nr:transketolase C-terminal domain-containing protein [Pseudomonadota bacterium]
LSRQSTPCVRQEQPDVNLVQHGGYVVRDARSDRDITLLASGTEVAIAMQAADTLWDNYQIDAAVVSMPCWELFEQQSEAWRQDVLGTAPRIAIEAAGGFGWERYIEDSAHFIGMTGFGDSGPAEALYAHFGITNDAIVLHAREVLAS